MATPMPAMAMTSLAYTIAVGGSASSSRARVAAAPPGPVKSAISSGPGVTPAASRVWRQAVRRDSEWT